MDSSHGYATAAVLRGPRSIAIESVKIPETSDDDGLLEVEACGLCGSDYEQYLGHLAGVMGRTPIVPGHEIVGRIAAVGRRARDRWRVEEGDRVAIEPVIPCGMCVACLTGFYTRCADDRGYGLYQTLDVRPALWGGYATHLYLHPRSIVHKVSGDIPSSLMTLFNPLSNAIRWTTEIPKLAPGSSVLIQGPGQRGLCAVVAARDAGAEEVFVTGATGDDHRLELARLLGATGVINSGKNDPVEAVAEMTSGRMVDVVVDVSGGNDAAFDVATRSVRRGGEIVLAGLNGHRPAVGLISDRVVLNEIRITGALSAGYTAVKRAISLIESSRYALEILCTHTFPLGEVERALKTLGRENRPEMDGVEPVHVTLSARGPGADCEREPR